MEERKERKQIDTQAHGAWRREWMNGHLQYRGRASVDGESCIDGRPSSHFARLEIGTSFVFIQTERWKQSRKYRQKGNCHYCCSFVLKYSPKQETFSVRSSNESSYLVSRLLRWQWLDSFVRWRWQIERRFSSWPELNLDCSRRCISRSRSTNKDNESLTSFA
jgi:hypothetical protein